MAPRFPNRLARVFFFSAESVCAVCERELVQAAQSAGVGRREGVSARGTVSDAGAVRCRAPQLQQASARQASASQMQLMRVAAAVQSAAPTQEEGAAEGEQRADLGRLRRDAKNSSPNTRRSTPADGLAATRGARYQVAKSSQESLASSPRVVIVDLAWSIPYYPAPRVQAAPIGEVRFLYRNLYKNKNIENQNHIYKSNGGRTTDTRHAGKHEDTALIGT